MRSLYHQDCTLPELQDMLERYPQAANHDQMHYVFADSHADTVNPFLIGSLELEGDTLAWALAKILCDPANVDLVIWGAKAEVSWLNKHPAWRIWCAKYSDDQREQFKSDWEYIKQMVANAMPDKSGSWPEYNESITYKEGREIIFTAIVNNS